MQCNHVYTNDPDKKCPYPGYYERWKLELPIDKEGECLFHSEDYDFKVANNFVEQYKTFIEKQNQDDEIEEIVIDEVIFLFSKSIVADPSLGDKEYITINYLKSVIFDSCIQTYPITNTNEIEFRKRLFLYGRFVKQVRILNASVVYIEDKYIIGSEIDLLDIENVDHFDYFINIDEDLPQPIFNIKMINVNLNNSAGKTRDLILKLLEEGRADIDETVIWPKSPLVLQNESKELANYFTFTLPIPEEQVSAFGSYLATLPQFLKLTADTRVRVEIRMNGDLAITFTAENDKILKQAKLALYDYLTNLSRVFNREKPIIHTPISEDLTAYKIALVHLEGAINNLSANLYTSNQKYIEESEKRKLADLMLQLAYKELESVRVEKLKLSDANLILSEKIIELQSKLTSMSVENILYKDEVLTVIGAITEIKLALQSQEKSRVSKAVAKLKDVYTLNQDKLKLIPLAISLPEGVHKLSDLVQFILHLFK